MLMDSYVAVLFQIPILLLTGSSFLTGWRGQPKRSDITLLVDSSAGVTNISLT